MSDFPVIVIGGSAGAIEVLIKLAKELPANLNAAIFVTIHITPSAPGALPSLVARRCPLNVCQATDGHPIRPGMMVFAPPDRHLLIQRGYIRVGRGPRENGHRPAVDPLFRTAAQAYHDRVIAVVLSGNLDDGASGLRVVRQAGGKSIIQDPSEALFSGMPTTALDEAGADRIVKSTELADALVSMVHEVTRNGRRNDPEAESMDIDERKSGKLAPFGCPDCGGTLWESQEGDVLHYRCRVGHAFSDESLLEAQADGLERAMWTALRALEEMAAHSTRLSERMEARGHSRMADRFARRARDAAARADIIRQALQVDDETEDNSMEEAS